MRSLVSLLVGILRLKTISYASFEVWSGGTHYNMTLITVVLFAHSQAAVDFSLLPSFIKYCNETLRVRFLFSLYSNMQNAMGFFLIFFSACAVTFLLHVRKQQTFVWMLISFAAKNMDRLSRSLERIHNIKAFADLLFSSVSLGRFS